MKHIYLLLMIYANIYAQQPCPGIATVNYGGQIYNTVAIGGQCWLKENLNVGIMIDSLANPSNNGIIEKYCYGNNLANCTTYGGLYQWDEAMQYVTTSGTKGICPSGWHMPTNTEFQTLATTVSNDGNALKAVGQGTGNGAGTNSSGFSALLAGARGYAGNFYSLGYNPFLWSSTVDNATYAILMYLSQYDGSIFLTYNDKGYGFSVRCIKDASTDINDHSNKTLPKSIDLLQNYPNPFNPSTIITYSLPLASDVKLIIYNSLGQTIQVLENGYKNAGSYSVTFNTIELPSGIYLYRLEAGQYTQVRKMILIK
jgi:uncharacterized protein (TIGR02145 family)